MKTIGDTTRPRVYCLECGEILYCGPTSRTRGEIMERRLEKIHNRTGCTGDIQYMAGITVRLPIAGMTK